MIRAAIGRMLLWFLDGAKDHAARVRRNNKLNADLAEARAYFHPEQAPQPPSFPPRLPKPPPMQGWDWFRGWEK